MYQPARGIHYRMSSVYVDGSRLGVVDKFVYLGSILNRHCSLDGEIALRVKRPAMHLQHIHVWSQRGIKTDKS